jgi:mono/diheme cytochrome c family protein
MRFFAGFLTGLLVVAVGAAIFAASGAYNIAALNPPGKIETRLATFALNRSVAKRALAGKNPLTASPQVLREGLAHYKENCVVCHGAPGVDVSELGQGLNPPAPDLTLPRVQARPDGQVFWIVSNGIRTTGMPAFSPTHKPDEIWKLVAFIRHLEEITPAEQQTLRAAAEEGEHHHEGEETGANAEAKDEQKPAAEKKAGHTHPPGTKPHKD